LEQERLLNE
jgi:hypothetical protein